MLNEFYCTAVPRFQRRLLGYSVQQLPIEAFFFNCPPPTQHNLIPVEVLFIGAFHGDEPESAEILYKLIDTIQQLPIEQRPMMPFIILPQLNPDGLLANTRKNANQVDLNRNWPTQNWEPNAQHEHYHSGPAPASEPETQLLQRLIEGFPPQRIVSLHTPYRCVNYDGPAEALAERYARVCGYPVEASIGYPTPGSFGTWAGVEREIPTLTVELPDNQPMAQTWAENREALLAMLSRD